MSPVVVDTDVVSLIFKRHSSSPPYVDLLEGRQVVLSFMTLAELRLWPLRGGWGEKRRHLLGRFLGNFEVCHSDTGLCESWAAVRQQCFRDGAPIDVSDAWIAATALYLEFPLVTHNRRHFERVTELELEPADLP